MICAIEEILHCLKVDIAEIIKPKRVELIRSLSKLVIFKVIVDLLYQAMELTEDKLVDESQIVIFKGAEIIFLAVIHLRDSKFEGIPYLIAELSVSNDSLHIEINVPSCNK